MATFELRDGFALIVFLGGWFLYNWVTEKSGWSRHGLSASMNLQRRRWMKVLLGRDLRMIDTAIMAGLQQGTAFFASSCIFAIGGCFALLGSADLIAQIAADLPFYGRLDQPLVEAKLLGLVTIFAYAFFKFGWSYRLFNYCTILIGAIPMRSDAERDPAAAELAVKRAATMNQIAASHFNAGLRGIFFGLAYLGWFLGPFVLMLTTVLVSAILLHRQFFSAARYAVRVEGED
ncbi:MULTISPECIES: DUF599 domain-containing protein [unclassified Aureimonas]|jgi:uncharacterized membrane protein|uniref:DUF599 domain-containing protein n=1 Tax=unclassified Aureimonas TaxID=2615206 RepID=UPI0006FF60CB|nr:MULTISPECIES: DUF599 family protein [unclassified Aureimonas]KQT60297.1 hypothetical protein ASG62_06415 [Aureimonas sp. Leaf427]KQT79173.1 hypothetical protein ASG54_09010 [Aureimonas sp. Leaf460]